MGKLLSGSFLGVLLLAVAPAEASIIHFSSNVTALPSAPASVSPSQSDTVIYTFLEQQDVRLNSPVTVGITEPGTWVCCSNYPIGQVPAGDVLDSYLVYAAPITNSQDFQGSVTFSNGEPIVGVMVGYEYIANTNSLFAAPGVTYPAANCNICGMENNDSVTLSADFSTVYVNFRVAAGNIDLVRVLTMVPEPGEFILIGSGLLALGFLKRPKFFRHRD